MSRFFNREGPRFPPPHRIDFANLVYGRPSTTSSDLPILLRDLEGNMLPEPGAHYLNELGSRNVMAVVLGILMSYVAQVNGRAPRFTAEEVYQIEELIYWLRCLTSPTDLCHDYIDALSTAVAFRVYHPVYDESLPPDSPTPRR